MGLDISVYKPVKATIETGEIEIFNIEDYPELAFFKEFIFEKENEYYNLQKELSKFPITNYQFPKIKKIQNEKFWIFL